MTVIPRHTFSENYAISRIIKGGWQLAGGHGIIDPRQALLDMDAYVQAGITTFDCADIYTGVEEYIGSYVAAYPDHQVQVHTKFVPDLNTLESLTATDVERVIDRSLSRLRVPCLDLVQFHWWDFSLGDHVAIARVLYDLQKAGKIRHIGVTNYDVVRLDQLVQAGIPIISNQVQYSVLDNRPEHGMVEYCQKNNISLLCYGTLAGGFLSERYLGKTEPQEPLENRSLVKYKRIIDDIGGWDYFQTVLSALDVVAKKHSVSIGTIATKYVLDRPMVAAAIVGSRDASHLTETCSVFDIALDNDDLQQIHSVLAQRVEIVGDIYSVERDREGKHGSIMKYNLNTFRP